MNKSNPLLLKIGVALCLAGCLSGCSKSSNDAASTAPPPAQPVAPQSAAAPPKTGNVQGPTAVPAPSGVDTGNYAGGRKN